jgi:hypothetical protein
MVGLGGNLLGLTGAEWFMFSLLGASMGAVIFLIFSSFFVLAIAAYIVRRVFGNVGSVLQRTWVRRTPKGALLHARWQAARPARDRRRQQLLQPRLRRVRRRAHRLLLLRSRERLR